jgi:ABC-2 type transport system ATP-binding protein
MGTDAPVQHGHVVSVTVRERRGTIVEAVRRLDEAGVDVDDVTLRRPTLDDVFLALTGRTTEAGEPVADAGAAGGQAPGRDRMAA